jgi:hypothetical protein
MTNRILETNRRAILGTLVVGVGSVMAGCSRSSIDGAVVENETPLTLSHEYGIQATSSGTRVVVDVTVTNEGSEQITPEGRSPRFICTFLDNSEERLFKSSRKLVDVLDTEDSMTVQFALSVGVDDVAEYELRSEWAEE